MNERRDTIDFLFKKALAIEKYHPEEAIKCYTAILEYECKTQREQLEKNRVATDVYGNKGIALERLGRHEEAEKCFAKIKKIEAKKKEAEEKWLAAEQERLEAERKKAKKKAKVEAKKKAEAMQKTKDVKIKKRWFEEVWSRIIKNEGKLMKTKRGVVFSYRTTKYKKSIMPQLRLQNSGPKFPVYSEGRYITNTLVERALDIVPVVGPTYLKRYLDLQSLDTAQTHLWGILHDERISKGDW